MDSPTVVFVTGSRSSVESDDQAASVYAFFRKFQATFLHILHIIKCMYNIQSKCYSL